MPVPHPDDDVLFHPPPPTESTSNAAAATTTKWGPYSGAGDFGANMAIVLAALFGTIILSFSLGAAVLLLLRRQRRRRHSERPEKPVAVAMPTMVFAAAGTKLAGAEAECSICLTEFVEGDAVRVLPACSHGFHVRCIEQWLAARSSCPTCRAFCNMDVSPREVV